MHAIDNWKPFIHYLNTEGIGDRIVEFDRYGKTCRAIIEHYSVYEKHLILKVKDVAIYNKQKKEFYQENIPESCLTLNIDRDSWQKLPKGTIKINSKMLGIVCIFPPGEIHNRDMPPLERHKSTNEIIVEELSRFICMN